MSGIFLDTGYLIALVNKRDNFHNIAIETSNKYHGPFLTTQLILIELANSLCLPSQKTLDINIIKRIQNDPLTTIVPFSPDRFEKAFSLFKKRSDKSWGFIDCFSFIVMDELGIKQA